MTQASPPTSRPPTPVLFLALVGGDTRQRDAARETWLNQHHVRALAEGSCAYSFYVAAGEHEAAQVRAHEWVDTVAVLSQAPVAFRNTWWARAWGVDGNTSFPYNGPKTVGSAGRWLFLLINTMRHALLSATGFRYFAKPELDGIVCVDSMVQTLRLAAAWRHSLFAGFMRGCHFDEAFALYSSDVVRALAGGKHRWERLVVPTLRPIAVVTQTLPLTLITLTLTLTLTLQ